MIVVLCCKSTTSAESELSKKNAQSYQLIITNEKTVKSFRFLKVESYWTSFFSTTIFWLFLFSFNISLFFGLPCHPELAYIKHSNNAINKFLFTPKYDLIVYL